MNGLSDTMILLMAYLLLAPTRKTGKCIAFMVTPESRNRKINTKGSETRLQAKIDFPCLFTWKEDSLGSIGFTPGQVCTALRL